MLLYEIVQAKHGSTGADLPEHRLTQTPKNSPHRRQANQPYLATLTSNAYAAYPTEIPGSRDAK